MRVCGGGSVPFVGFQVVSHERPEYTPWLSPLETYGVSLASAEFT